MTESRKEFSVKISPGSSRNDLVLGDTHDLKVNLTAVPIDGEANRALVKFLLKRIKTAPSKLKILKGELSQIKTLVCEGMDWPEVRGRLGL